MVLQWFILSLATLTLSTVVSATGVFFVKPTNDTPCPQQPCHTLEHYTQSWQLYLTSNTIVQFLPGEHVLEGDWNELAVENVSNLTLIGSDSALLDSSPLGIPMATSRISCRRGKTMFSYTNVTELFIIKLTFSDCGGGKATLALYEVSDLILDNVAIQNSIGTGLMGLNLGKSLIHHSSFMFSQATSAFSCSANIMLFYEKCSQMIETYTLNINSSWILFGNATTESECVGGLYLELGQLCYNMKVHILNTTFNNNLGGNMLLKLNNGFAQNIITVTDSHFEGGYTLDIGGGISIYTKYNASRVAQLVQNNRVYINNTEFVGNHADFGGAVAVSPCTGTEVYIIGSRFYNNVADGGGHIFISLISSYCANVTITMSNSLFVSGKATGHGGGGGVAVVGIYSDLQSTNGNYIYISDTRFVGNYAQNLGGAVALLGCSGAELKVDETGFFNNTTPSDGGHIALELNSDCIQLIIVNNSHFEGGKAHAGGGISMFAKGGCTPPVSSTIHKSVYIMNSKVYQNLAEVAGGGLAIQFKQSCFAINVIIHNVLLSSNVGNSSLSAGGNIFIPNFCTAYITISKSTVEFGNASGIGGGMAFLTTAFPGCPSSMIGLKPNSINIVDSTFQYNTARKSGGGLDIEFSVPSEYFCSSAEVKITNVTFLNNTVSTVPYEVNGAEVLTQGGNIYILDINGHWFNNSVRIHNCLIEGGIAMSGGGIYSSTLITNSVGFCQKRTEMEVLIISNTHFICNRATYAGLSGASLLVHELPNVYNMTFYSMVTTIYFKKIRVIDSIFDGTCANFSNIIITGLEGYAPYLPTRYSVAFINVSFQGYSTDLSSPPSTFHSQQQFDNLILTNPSELALYTPYPGVRLFFIPNTTFIGCEFFESTVESALYAVSTNVFFGGNITFRDNIATYGGGLLLLDNSVMYLTPNTHIVFSHNHATYAGGAIYVKSDGFSLGNGKSMCFYQFDAINQNISDLNIQITFENNTAYFAGSALYGGFVDICLIGLSTERNNYFDSIFKVQNTDENPTAISSDPQMVCPCNESKPNCGSCPQVWSVYTYPGAQFHLQAVIVGQKDGIVPGVVRAAVQNTSAVLGDLQYSQATGKSCTTLNYTVYSSPTEETITLMTETIPNRLTLKGLIINVTLLPCPWGFTLTGAPPKCDCADELRKHHIDTCNITTNTITRPPPLWIGYYHSGNNSEHPVEGVLVHDSCPFDYCKPEQLSIQLNDSDKQCAFNHSGILCGACQPGLSLALGTSRCLKCSNKYLMLLFAFTAAGLALVFLLMHDCLRRNYQWTHILC